MRVGGRIPGIVVNAVGDPDEAISACSEQPVESVALLWRLYFLGVAAADGGKHIACHQTGLHRRRRPVKCKQVLRLEAVEAKPRQIRRIESALVSEVVD
ncbi:MAG: hypothetical protein WKF84_08245 [Pyrinomonadaceae bacterium]